MKKMMLVGCAYICVILSSEAMHHHNGVYEILNKFQEYALHDNAICASEQQLLDLKKDIELLQSGESIIQRMISSIDDAISCEREGTNKRFINPIVPTSKMHDLWNSLDFKKYARSIGWDRPLTQVEQTRKLVQTYWDYAYEKKPYKKDELQKIQQLIKNSDYLVSIQQHMMVSIEKSIQDGKTRSQ